jgi:hypothetical protein
MNKVDEIKQQLAQRLEKQTPRSPKGSAEPNTRAVTTTTVKDPARVVTTAAASSSDKRIPDGTGKPTAEGVIKLSASLYNFDIECLDRIREFMRSKGVRNITDSEALRLACRAVKVDDSFMDIYQEMTKDDRRRRK